MSSEQTQMANTQDSTLPSLYRDQFTFSYQIHPMTITPIISNSPTDKPSHVQFHQKLIPLLSQSNNIALCCLLTLDSLAYPSPRIPSHMEPLM